MDSSAQPGKGESGLSARAAWIGLTVVVAAGVALRCLQYSQVFLPEAVVFPGHDPYYHMRRVLLILESYPQAPLFDAWINYPVGAVAIWTPLFDLFVASVIRLAGFGADDVRAAETIASWIVPIVGAATVLPLYGLGHRLAGRGIGLLAGALLVLSPSHVWYSRLGFVDHHAAVTLIQVVLFLVFTRAVVPRDGRPRAGAVAGTVVCIVAGLLTWSGFLLFVAMIDLFLMLRLIAFRQDRHGPRLIWMVHLPAALLLLPSAVSWVRGTGEPFTAITLSYFHVAALAWFGLLGAVADGYRSPRSRAWRRPLRLALPLALAVGTLVFLVRTSALGEGLDWLLARDVFMSQVNESQPLLDLARQGDSMRVELHGMATVLLPVAALAWGWLAFRRWRPWGPADAPRQLFLVWSAALLLASTGQRRFLESFAPAEGLLVALALAALMRSAWRRASARVPALLGLTLVLGAAFVPWHSGEFRKDDRARARRGDVWFHGAIRGFHGKVDPPPITPPRGEIPPFGALGPWYLGHRILYLTGLPVVSNNFGSHIGADSYRDWSAFFLSDSEAEAVSLLTRRNVRYVFVDHDLDFVEGALGALGLPVREYFVVRHIGEENVFTPLEPYLKTMAFRLANLRGAQRSFLDRKDALFTVPALDRLRLVHEKPREDPRISLKIYELVRGATLRLAGEPGELVSVHYTDSFEPPLRYSKTLVVGEQGWAETVVPYSSDRPGLAMTGAYRIRVGESLREVRVPEAAVQEGRVITLPAPD